METWSPRAAARGIQFTDFFDYEHDCSITLQPTNEEAKSVFWISLVEDPLKRRFIPYRGLRSARHSTSRPSASRRSTSQLGLSRRSPSRPSTSRQDVPQSEVPDLDCTFKIPIQSQELDPHRRSATKRSRRASSAEPYFQTGRASSSQPLDDDSLQRLADICLVEPIAHRLADRLVDPIAAQLADRLVDRIAARLADRLVEPIAAQLADRLVDPIVAQLADRLVDPIAARLADRLVEPLAARLADRLVDPIAARITEKLKPFIQELFHSLPCWRT